jgi:hypothetical protein
MRRLEEWTNRVAGPAFLRGRCQAQNLLGDHTVETLLVKRVSRTTAVRSRLKQALTAPRKNGAAAKSPLGSPSKFAPGAWVRVLDEPEIKATLDARDRLGGLEWVPQQWAYCKGIFRVQSVVQRILDDHGTLRPISRTLILEGVDCGGLAGIEGCGRFCPLFFRDAWLAPAESLDGIADGVTFGAVVHATVRTRAEIESTLDATGRLDGLAFMAEMASYAGRRLRLVRRIKLTREFGQWVHVPKPVFVLEGLHCSGQVLGAEGPCHRGCPLLWHARWLNLEAGAGTL